MNVLDEEHKERNRDGTIGKRINEELNIQLKALVLEQGTNDLKIIGTNPALIVIKCIFILAENKRSKRCTQEKFLKLLLDFDVMFFFNGI